MALTFFLNLKNMTEKTKNTDDETRSQKRIIHFSKATENTREIRKTGRSALSVTFISAAVQFIKLFVRHDCTMSTDCNILS